MLSNSGQVIEHLLRGDFICRTSNEEAWRHLKSPANRALVEDYLSKLNRTVCVVGTDSDSDVFFCGYIQLGDAEKRQLSIQFKDIYNALSPLIEWLVLVQEASSQDAPLIEGSPVRLNELQSMIEDTPAFKEQLTRISHYHFFGSTSVDIDKQLKQVFKRLCEQGYLLKPNHEKQIYIATGKLDYLYEVIHFINEAEDLKLEEKVQDSMLQESLFQDDLL